MDSKHQQLASGQSPLVHGWNLNMMHQEVDIFPNLVYVQINGIQLVGCSKNFKGISLDQTPIGLGFCKIHVCWGVQWPKVSRNTGFCSNLDQGDVKDEIYQYVSLDV